MRTIYVHKYNDIIIIGTSNFEEGIRILDKLLKVDRCLQLPRKSNKQNKTNYQATYIGRSCNIFPPSEVSGLLNNDNDVHVLGRHVFVERSTNMNISSEPTSNVQRRRHCFISFEFDTH